MPDVQIVKPYTDPFLSGKGHRIWADCPVHDRPTTPLTVRPYWNGPQDLVFEIKNDEYIGQCGTCYASAKLRFTRPTQKTGKGTDKCDSRCLNGKTDCSCKCFGLCHGRGKCYCNPMKKE